jgi:hypothetical protein
MDAIRAKEWKMIVVLKNMSEEAAYRVFALIHIPLYVAVIFVLFHGDAVASYVLKMVIDVFLLGHAIIHYSFRKHSDNGFKTWFSKSYADEKCVTLAKEIKLLVDDKAQFADWSTRDDIKNQLNMDLTVLLYKNGYPPEWDEEVFEKVLEQAENFKKWTE